MMIADQTGLDYGDFIHTFGDAHLYLNHVQQAKEQLTRAPKKLPTLIINKNVESIFNYSYENFTLKNYNAHEHIKAKVSV